MGSGQSFYNYVEKNNNKIACVENSLTKKTSFGAMTGSVVMILKKISFIWNPLKK